MRKIRICGDRDNALSLIVTDAETGERIQDIERLELVLTATGWIRAHVTRYATPRRIDTATGKVARVESDDDRIELDIVAGEVPA